MDAPVGPKRNYSADASRERLEPELLQKPKRAKTSSGRSSARGHCRSSEELAGKRAVQAPDDGDGSVAVCCT